MNAIRLQQLCGGPADPGSGTLWPKCHSSKCFQWCGDHMEEIGALQDPDYLHTETWTIHTWYWLWSPSVRAQYTVWLRFTHVTAAAVCHCQEFFRSPLTNVLKIISGFHTKEKLVEQSREITKIMNIYCLQYEEWKEKSKYYLHCKQP